MEIKDIESLAELARLRLSEAEKKSLQKDLESILNYIEEVKSAQVPGQTEGEKLYNIWREDQALPREYSLDLITSQFPHKEKGFLKVKKIL